MLKSCDSGSFPFFGDTTKFLIGAEHYSLNQIDESSKYFEEIVLENFVDKIKIGIDVPNYPQFRSMNEMFLSVIDGLEKIDTGYFETKNLSLMTNKHLIPEILVLEKNSQMIKEKTESPFKVRVCVTGPYTLASLFPYRDERNFIRLGNVISQILEIIFFNNKNGKITLVSVDEPLFGLMDDPLIDFGSEGKENLQKAWETIFYKIKSMNIQTMLHLHSTANPLFWDTQYLDVIDSHVNDPLHQMKKTSEMLESKDKYLKASITVNDFDLLIKQWIISDSQNKELTESAINEHIAQAWYQIKNGTIDPNIFLDSAEKMKARIVKVVNQFGVDRVLYTGPECGLKGYPTYKNALDCLRRVVVATKRFQNNGIE
jgi:5-methyltetrahydropteroyltriglutamate--homocysteine methyltransferase